MTKKTRSTLPIGLQVICSAAGMLIYIAWLTYSFIQVSLIWKYCKGCYIGFTILGICLLGAFVVPFSILYSLLTILKRKFLTPLFIFDACNVTLSIFGIFALMYINDSCASVITIQPLIILHINTWFALLAILIRCIHIYYTKKRMNHLNATLLLPDDADEKNNDEIVSSFNNPVAADTDEIV
tara:strand:+ start:36 stop:584 length:549 start_codon:yes stop_codon:yes gene_type:complete